MKILCGLILLSLAGCGTRTFDNSDLSERHKVDISPDAIPEIDSLISGVREVLASDTRTGRILSRHLLNMLPMAAADRTRLKNNFSEFMDVVCDDNDRCIAKGSGRPTEVRMNVRVAGISNPTLGIQRQLVTKLFVRDDRTIESCQIGGMYVKKLFVVKDVQGMLMSHNTRAVNLTVNLENTTPYTCN